MSNEQPQLLTIRQQMERGRCIARLYISAQHLSEIASTAALELLDNASPWEKRGFDQEMSKSPFPVRCKESPSFFFRSRLVRNDPAQAAARIKLMITPPWMNA